MSLGEDRIRVKFNPSDQSDVDTVKSLSADLIDILDNIGYKSDEQARLIKIAQTKYEEAAMWAVKALTA